MNILTTLYHLKNIKELSTFADGFLMGNELFGTRLTQSFSIEDLVLATKQIKDLGKTLFIVANQIFVDKQLDAFEHFILALPMTDIKGVIVADLGAFSVLKRLGYAEKVIYNPETLMTNFYDFNFLSNAHIQGVYVAKEITLEDVIEIGKQKKYQMFMVGHGHLNMFYSKRQLIDNFMYFNASENPYHNRQDMKIVEEHRKDEPYPILEDHAGTHVFRSQVFSSLEYLSTLHDIVDYLVIDTIFKDDQYARLVLPMYIQNALNPSTIDYIKKTYKETWDEGFFYKKTIYQHKG